MTREHVRTPRALLADRSVSRGARELWQLLDDECREWSGVRRTRAQLAEKLGCSQDAVKKWRAALVKAGWLAHEAATNRGEVSGWVPLRRARPVHHQGWRPVDNSAGRGDGRGDRRTTSHQGKGGQPSPLDAAATHARPEEQKPDETPWCGHCDGPDYRWVVDEEHRPRFRCPTCHPDYAAHPAF